MRECPQRLIIYIGKLRLADYPNHIFIGTEVDAVFSTYCCIDLCEESGRDKSEADTSFIYGGDKTCQIGGYAPAYAKNKDVSVGSGLKHIPHDRFNSFHCLVRLRSIYNAYSQQLIAGRQSISRIGVPPVQPLRHRTSHLLPHIAVTDNPNRPEVFQQREKRIESFRTHYSALHFFVHLLTFRTQ